MYDVLTLQKWVRDLYASQNGGVVPPGLWIEPFGYPLTITGLVGIGGTFAGTLAINSNADFVLTRILGHANISTAQTVNTKTVPFVRLQLVDSGSARPFFNSAVDFENVCANAYAEHFLSYPRWLSANTTIQVQATGYATAAETYGQIELLFEGVSVRQLSQAMQASIVQG